MLDKFINKNQLEILNSGLDGEEGEYFKQQLADTLKTIQNMPQTYETENSKAEDIIIHLHYFSPSFDWYVTEKDINDGQHQAFGYVKMQFSELGYISIPELLQNNVELDMHWTPITLKEVMNHE